MRGPPGGLPKRFGRLPGELGGIAGVALTDLPGRLLHRLPALFGKLAGRERLLGRTAEVDRFGIESLCGIGELIRESFGGRLQSLLTILLCLRALGERLVHEAELLSQLRLLPGELLCLLPEFLRLGAAVPVELPGRLLSGGRRLLCGLLCGLHVAGGCLL